MLQGDRALRQRVAAPDDDGLPLLVDPAAVNAGGHRVEPAKHEVEPSLVQLLDDIEPADRHDAQPEPWRGLPEMAQQQREDHHAGVVRCADMEVALRLGGVELRRLQQRAEQLQRLPDIGCDGLRPGGRHHAAGAGHEELVIQQDAQAGERVAHRGGGQAQFPRCGGLAAMGHDGVEVAEQVEVRALGSISRHRGSAPWHSKAGILLRPGVVFPATRRRRSRPAWASGDAEDGYMCVLVCLRQDRSGQRGSD